MPAMYLAGLPMPGTDVLELARLVNGDPLADRARTRLRPTGSRVRPDVPERETLLWALDEPPNRALAELRATVLQEHVARVRDGLV